MRKMKKIRLLYLSGLVVILIISCNGPGRNSEKTVVAAGTSVENADAKAIVSEKISPGRVVYDKYCLTCHQADGSGVPGMYPPLKKAEKITGPADELLRVILFGLEGPIGEEGITYAQVMPAQDFISDDDLAVLVNYLKETWGDGGSAITPEDVKRIRDSGKK